MIKYYCDSCGKSSDNQYFLEKISKKTMKSLLYTDTTNKVRRFDLCEECYGLYIANMQNFEKTILEKWQDKKEKKIITQLKGRGKLRRWFEIIKVKITNF